jgi:YdcK Beta solenoid repeat
MKKYELTQETIQVDDVTLYRIKALIDFGQVSAGDLGGFVQNESNLGNKGNCWIYDDSRCFGKARVYGNASVSGQSWIHDDALVYGNATVSECSRVYGNAIVRGNVSVSGYKWLSGSTIFSCFGRIWE